MLAAMQATQVGSANVDVLRAEGGNGEHTKAPLIHLASHGSASTPTLVLQTTNLCLSSADHWNHMLIIDDMLEGFILQQLQALNDRLLMMFLQPMHDSG